MGSLTGSNLGQRKPRRRNSSIGIAAYSDACETALRSLRENRAGLTHQFESWIHWILPARWCSPRSLRSRSHEDAGFRGYGHSWNNGLIVPGPEVSDRVEPPARKLRNFVSMSELNSKRPATSHSGFEWAGTVARMRRGNQSGRAGRRSALLSMLTSAYMNSSRGGRVTETRGNSDRS